MFGEVLRPRRLIAGALLLAGVVLLATGCALIAVQQLTLSDISFVPHAGVMPVLKMGKHLKREITCLNCHAGAKKEDRAGMPDRKLCMICHEEVKEGKEKFVLGGPIFDAEGKPKWTVAAALPAGVIFSHAKHTKTHDCAECHGDVAHDRYAMVDLAVKFPNCRRCHLDENAPARAVKLHDAPDFRPAVTAAGGGCAYCHSALEKSSRPHSHDSRWRRYHGRHVRDAVTSTGFDSVDDTCNSCHSTSYCVSCHKQERPRDHTLFFTRAGHGLAADVDRERCAACHTQDRCVRCHLRNSPVRPPAHALSNCHLCHTRLRGHVMMTDNCSLCHR